MLDRNELARNLQVSHSTYKFLQVNHSTCKFLQVNPLLQETCKFLQVNHSVSTRVLTKSQSDIHQAILASLLAQIRYKKSIILILLSENGGQRKQTNTATDS